MRHLVRTLRTTWPLRWGFILHSAGRRSRVVWERVTLRLVSGAHRSQIDWYCWPLALSMLQNDDRQRDPN